MAFDAFHIEEDFSRVLGEWILKSVWNGASFHVIISSSSAVENFLNVTHILLI